MDKDLNTLIKYFISQTEYVEFAWINHELVKQDKKIERLTECLTELERHEILHTQYGKRGTKEYLMTFKAKQELSKLSDPYVHLLKKEQKEKRDKNKMNFAQKYWWAVTLFGLIVGWSLDVAKGPVSKRLDRWLNPIQAGQATPKGTDTFETHKTDSSPLIKDNAQKKPPKR